MFRRATIAIVLTWPMTLWAAPTLGELSIVSAPSQPFRAEVALTAQTPDDLANLQAGFAVRNGVRTGALDRVAFRLETRGLVPYLIAESTTPLGTAKLDVSLGVESATGTATRDYSLNFRSGRWILTADAASGVSASALAARPDAGQETRLRLSTELNFVVPFADGRAQLGPKGRTAIAKLADMAGSAERAQIKGWAGRQDAEKRETLAFNRAYLVRRALAQQGVSEDTLRIMRPALALEQLDADGVTTPRVVVTLLNGEAHAAAVDATDAHDFGIRFAQVANAPLPQPVALAFATRLNPSR